MTHMLARTIAIECKLGWKCKVAGSPAGLRAARLWSDGVWSWGRSAFR
jgi:hypothetical protein